MNSSISIEVSSPNSVLNRLRPNGVSIGYAVNAIPQAVLPVPPESLELLCDFESFRREPVNISIKTINGCISFDGLADGLSVNQSAGDISLGLVVKSKFQVLAEVMPKFIGLHPSAYNLFTRSPGTYKQQTSGPLGNTSTETSFINKFYWLIQTRAGAQNIRDELERLMGSSNAVNFIPMLIRAFIYSQRTGESNITASTQFDPYVTESLRNLLNDPVVKRQIDKSWELMGMVDSKHTDKFLFLAGSQVVQKRFVSAIETSYNSVLELMMDLLASYDTSIVIGNNHIFTVPSCGFLKQQHSRNIPFGVGRWSSEANRAYPSQFNNFSFSDNGHVDVRGIFVASASADQSGPGSPGPDVGFYLDTNAKTGGIRGGAIPDFYSLNSHYIDSYKNQQVRKRLQAQAANFRGTDVLPGGGINVSLSRMQPHTRKYTELYQQNELAMRRLFGAEYAKSLYLKTKYQDRTGSINMIFNPSWAPGAIGTLYTRLPGVYVDFYVTHVNHNFSVSAPSTGNATTSVSFNCGRLGSSMLGTGLEEAPFYPGFNAESSYEFASAFINDIL